MPGLTSTMLKTAVAATAVAFVTVQGAVPELTGSFCANVVETLTQDGTAEPLSTNGYNLCVDNVNLRWSQKMDTQLNIFNGTDLWKLSEDAGAPGGWSCVHTAPGRDAPTNMPYTMVKIDDEATLNATETYDGISGAENWYNARPAKQSGIFVLPAEDMHWHITPSQDNNDLQRLLATECIQPSGDDRTGPLQHGIRDFSDSFSPFSERTIPHSIECTEGLSSSSSSESNLVTLF